MSSGWLSELREAYSALAGEGLYTTGGGSEAWNRLSALIQRGPPVSTLDALPEIQDEDDIPLAEKRKEVLEALYQAATSGNVTAILKWLDRHRDELDSLPASDGSGESETAESERSHSQMIEALEEAFPDLTSRT